MKHMWKNTQLLRGGLDLLLLLCVFSVASCRSATRHSGSLDWYRLSYGGYSSAMDSRVVRICMENQNLRMDELCDLKNTPME